MSKITFIIGGARSGKSNYALSLAKKVRGRIAFIATAQAKDEEMKERIRLHKKARPANWHTFEEPQDIKKAVKQIDSKHKLVIIDCLTLWVSNLIAEDKSDKIIEEEIFKVLSILKKNKLKALIISNEVGLGLVPTNALGRRFRDLAGKINQIVAREAQEVIFMASGIAMQLRNKRSCKNMS